MIELRPGAVGYPALLGAVSSAPALFVRGELRDEDALAVAIVGSRRATPYGIAATERLASDLAARGVTIVSGLARGIDTAAHRSALAAGGRTLAVRGAILSQFPPGMPALAGHFPARNRTLAGLALGVVVVEAAERSGALITAGFAGDLGRETFAVPGRITSPTSAGTNRLIQDGAKLVTCWQDIVSELPEQWRRAVRGSSAPPGAQHAPEPGSDEGRMLQLLAPDEPRHIEQLIARAEFAPARAAALLVTLELGGWARQLAGQRWVSLETRARRA